MPRDSQYGLEWEHGIFQTIPRWAQQPSVPAIENVARQHLNIPPAHPCTVSFFAAGAFNRLYLVKYGNDASLLFRVSLPVYPRHKTRGEVATLTWVRQNTSAPVPKVIAFDDNNDNEIGFEWILMEVMPGSTAHDKWRTMSMEQKEGIAKRLAEIQTELVYYQQGNNDNNITGIGKLHSNKAQVDDVFPGQLVSTEFFITNRVHYDVPRGPFDSSRAWLDAQLNIVRREQQAVLGDENSDEDDKEDAQEILDATNRLLPFLPKVFPADSTQDSPEPTIIWHEDLNLRNILVDDQTGEITAILDWECVSVLPLWVAASLPKLLQEDNRPEKPKREDYFDEAAAAAAGENGTNCESLDDQSNRSLESHQGDSCLEEPRGDGSTDDAPGKGDDHSDNEFENSLYWEHMMEYEVTCLRRVFDERLAELWPDCWPPEKDSDREIDFYEAVLQCSAGFTVRNVNKWIDHMERGEDVRLKDVRVMVDEHDEEVDGMSTSSVSEKIET